MNRSIIASETYRLGATSDYTILQPLGEEPVSMESPSRLFDSSERFNHSSIQQSRANSTTVAVITLSKTTTAEMPVVLMYENLSAEDKEARKKGLALVARFEYLIETDEGFRRWLQTGLDQAEVGEIFAFDEIDWEE